MVIDYVDDSRDFGSSIITSCPPHAQHGAAPSVDEGHVMQILPAANKQVTRHAGR